jgi:hypothetical protein
MGHFLSYDTTDGTNPPVAASGVVILGGGWVPPLDDPTSPTGPVDGQTTVWTGSGLTGIASRIAGSCFSQLGGTLVVEQSFDGVHWDDQTSYTIAANTVNAGIDQDVLAPFLRISYTNTAGSTDSTIRIFFRIFGGGRNNM